MHPLRIFRKKHHVTRNYLGKQVGVTGAQIGHIELGRRNCTVDLALALEKATLGQVGREDLLPKLFKGFQRVA